MAEINISDTAWARLKLKLKRKYTSLNDNDLVYQAGQEEELITRLMARIHRDRQYVIFTLKKGLAYIDDNRL